MSAIDDLAKMLKKERSGTDYTGTVTRIKNGVAYVRLTGSEINDTPVSMTISAKPGDKVRVRVSKGKAWITGNDTAPPTNNTEEIEEIKTTSSKQLGVLSESNRNLKTRVKALETSSTISLTGQSTVLSNVKISKVGRLVTLTILDGAAQSVSAWTSLLQLDSKYAPIQDVEFMDTYGKKRMIISAAGVIKNIEALTSYVRGSVTYISAT